MLTGGECLVTTIPLEECPRQIYPSMWTVVAGLKVDRHYDDERSLRIPGRPVADQWGPFLIELTGW